MRPELLSFTYCPIGSRFIDTREEAASYYAHKMQGDHAVQSRGVPIVVRFQKEETHVYTDGKHPCPQHHVIVRDGGREVRCLCLIRARLMDLIVPTIKAPTKTLRAKIRFGVMLFGPEDPKSKRRICVVVAPEAPGTHLYFVRTMFEVSPTDYARYLRTEPGATWPHPVEKK